MTPRTRLDASSRRAQILGAAHELFSTRTYEAVTLADIADATGITRANLHYHFGTKRDLYVEVVREFVRLPPLPPERTPRGSLEEEVRRTLAGWLDVVLEHRGTFASILTPGSIQQDPEIAALLEGGREEWAARMLELLALPDTPRDRAMVRAWQSMAEASIDEWLVRGRLERHEVLTLLEEALLAVAVRVVAA